MVEINLRELAKEFLVASVAATTMYVGINKLPEYLRKVGEERERKRAEYQLQLLEKGFEKMSQPLEKRLQEIEKVVGTYKSEGAGQ